MRPMAQLSPQLFRSICRDPMCLAMARVDHRSRKAGAILSPRLENLRAGADLISGSGFAGKVAP